MTPTVGGATFSVTAKQPKAAMVVLPLFLTAEIIAGWLVDHFNWIDLTLKPSKHYEAALLIGRVGWQDYGYLIFVASGLTIGVTQLTNVGISTVCSSYLVFTNALIDTFLGGAFIRATSTLKTMINLAD